MGNNSGIHPPFLRDIWSRKTSETLFLFVIFSILNLVQQKVNGLAICSKNQFRDNFIRNRLEKLVPVTNITSPGTKKTEKKKPTNLFSNLDYFGPIWGAPPRIFQGFPMDFPRISHGFPKDFPWISHHPFLNFRGGRGSGRQISRPGSLGRAL